MRPIGPRLLALLCIALFATTPPRPTTARSSSSSRSGRVPEARLPTILDLIGKRGTAADLGYLFDVPSTRTVPRRGPAQGARRAGRGRADAQAPPRGRPRPARRHRRGEGSDPAGCLAAIRLAGLWKVETLGKPLGDLAGAADTPGRRSAPRRSMPSPRSVAPTRRPIEALTKPGRPCRGPPARPSRPWPGSTSTPRPRPPPFVLRDAAPGAGPRPDARPVPERQRAARRRWQRRRCPANLPPDAAKLGLRALRARQLEPAARRRPEQGREDQRRRQAARARRRSKSSSPTSPPRATPPAASGSSAAPT